MGAGGAEIYNPAGAEGAGEKGGAAVVAQGGHSIRLSCCCNKSLLFAKSVLCVCAFPARGSRARSPARGAEVGPSGSGDGAELGCERGGAAAR